MGLESLAKILRRVAYPVEPFGIKSVQNVLPPPLLDGNRDRLGKQPGLFDQLDDCQANELQSVHNPSLSNPSTGPGMGPPAGDGAELQFASAPFHAPELAGLNLVF